MRTTQMRTTQPIKTPLELAAAVLVAAPFFHYSVTSWIRSPKRNASVGGSSTSQHLVGAAFDLVLDNMTEANKAVLAKYFEALGCWVLVEDDHVHVQVARQWLNAGEYITP